MRLQSKLALFNAVSKALIVLLFVVVLPAAISGLAIVNTDEKLTLKKNQVLEIIKKEGISHFIEAEQDDGYGSYNLLKEEFISLERADEQANINTIENSQRSIDDEIVDYRVLSYSFRSGGHLYLLEIGRSIVTIVETEKTLRKFALYLLVIIVLVTILIDIAFTQYLLRPLDNIIRTKLKNVRDPASFRHDRIQTSTSDFQHLDESIHEMMQRIEEAFVKEREFISNVSHELLTPVSILQSKLENLMQEPNLSDKHLMRLVESQKTLARLRNVIKTLLLISRIENAQYLKNESVWIGQLVAEVVEEIGDRLQEKNITILNNIQEDCLLPQGNRPLLFTLLFNLINNAIKYNRPDGKIILNGSFQKGHYALDIQDTGIGIQPEHVPLLFNRFKRFAKSDHESYGLGLPIVKTIANFHEIELEVTSIPDEGSTFRLIFQHITSLSTVPDSFTVIRRQRSALSKIS
jgi:signal transduction histidine kinase